MTREPAPTPLPEESGGAVALDARGLHAAFGHVVALDGVSLHVDSGSCVALVGESGAGKTTLLRCFNRMVEPASGEVLIGNVDVTRPPAAELRRQIGYVPQHGGLLP